MKARLPRAWPSAAARARATGRKPDAAGGSGRSGCGPHAASRDDGSRPARGRDRWSRVTGGHVPRGAIRPEAPRLAGRICIATDGRSIRHRPSGDIKEPRRGVGPCATGKVGAHSEPSGLCRPGITRQQSPGAASCRRGSPPTGPVTCHPAGRMSRQAEQNNCRSVTTAAGGGREGA